MTKNIVRSLLLGAVALTFAQKSVLAECSAWVNVMVVNETDDRKADSYAATIPADKLVLTMKSVTMDSQSARVLNEGVFPYPLYLSFNEPLTKAYNPNEVFKFSAVANGISISTEDLVTRLPQDRFQPGCFKGGVQVVYKLTGSIKNTIKVSIDLPEYPELRGEGNKQPESEPLSLGRPTERTVGVGRTGISVRRGVRMVDQVNR